MNPEKGTEIAACWKEFHPEIRSILKKATAKKYAGKDIQKNFEKNHEEEKSNRVTSQCEPLGFIKICICMPCVFQGKIIADENHLGKGEALD